MRFGIYGGSFDPIHFGHLLLAECCREQRELDQVRFVPAAQSPHKLETRPASATARSEMVQLAIGGHPNFLMDPVEVNRGGLSYTIDTLKGIRQRYAEAELFLLMGADTLVDFPKWKSPGEICEICDLIVVQRPGHAPANFANLGSITTPERIADFEGLVVVMPQIDLSSREIRLRVAHRRSIRFQMPRAVEEYIQMHKLYAE